MDKQRGYTLVELAIAIGILTLMAGMAGLAGLRFIWTSGVISEATRLADQLSIARERAVAGHAGWRVRFLTDTQYVLETCSLNAGESTGDCTSWQQEGYPLTLEHGVMAKPDASTVTFDPTGRAALANHFVVEVCTVFATGGTQTCRSDARSRFVVVRKLTGIVDMVNSRSDIR